MPNFKKNAMNQVMFPMVDRTDFATVESAITASDFNSAATKKIFGVNHGVSDAFTSATISKAATLVRSGIFQQTLKASECNYDYLIVKFTHPSCADQMLIFQPQEVDPSDMYSMLSDFLSDFQSRIPKAVATNSQLSDLHSDLRSFLVVMSDVQSDFYSDFQSRVPKRVATDSQLSDLHSDLRSFLVVMSGIQSDILSSVSDLQSDFQSRVPKRVATDSQLSDVLSDLRSLIGLGSPLTASDMSDLRSAISAGPAGALTVSDISDIASAVKVILASDMSDILSAAQQGNSRVLVVQSRVSDVQSFLSDMQSDLNSHLDTTGVNLNASVMSDLRSAIAGVTATLSASDISDIASAVKVILASDMSDILSAAQQGNSRVLVVQSHASNIYSMLSDLQSDFQSRVPKEVSSKSLLSDVHSDLRSQIGGITVSISASDVSDIASAVRAALISDLSDILSAAQQGNSRVLVVQSHASNIYSLLSDVDSNFQSRVPKLVATNSQLSDAQSDLRSAIAGITAGVSASDISDIASAVKAILNSDLSDILSAAQQGNSRVLVVQSHVSNIYSLLSDVDSNFQSRVPKLVATNSQLSDVQSDVKSAIAGITVTLSASDISDIASAVAAATTGLTPSDISDIVSAIVLALAGGGSKECILTVEDNGSALDGVDVWITTDILGTNIVARGYTNALGKVTFYLDPGTYYVWKQLSGFTFVNPEAMTVT